MSIPGLSRFLGSLFLILTGTLTGHGFAKNLEMRQEEAVCLEKGLIRLCSEISYGLAPLPTALIRAGEAAGGIFGEILCKMGRLSGLKEKRLPQEALEESLCSLPTIPPQQLVNILTDLSGNLGFLGHKEQQVYLESALHKVRAYLADNSREIAKRAKLYRYLGALLALCAVIVLI